LEAQISQAADELAREGRNQNAEPVASQGENAEPVASQSQKTEPAANQDEKAQDQKAKPAAKAKPAELRPVETRNGTQPAGFTPANDPRRKDYKTLLHTLNRRASNTIYWVVALVSLAWIAGAGALANLLFG
ncbi:MAG: hypothetical protein E5V18_25550, partial [Mesorhizobium sp.]